MKLGKLKNAQLSKQSHEIGFVQRVLLSILTLKHFKKIRSSTSEVRFFGMV
jgi:hypothetical protein